MRAISSHVLSVLLLHVEILGADASRLLTANEAAKPVPLGPIADPHLQVVDLRGLARHCEVWFLYRLAAAFLTCLYSLELLYYRETPAQFPLH